MRGIIIKLIISVAFFVFLLEVAGRVLNDDAVASRSAGAPAWFAALGVHPSDQPIQPAPPVTEKKGFRIVVLGDSTAAGFPYSPELSFGKLLAAGLAAASGKACETAIIAIPGRSSDGVVADLPAAFAAAPDLILIYIGHNEFAHRISRVSPWGRPRRGFPATWLRGTDNILKSVRDAARRPDFTNLPAQFSSELRVASTLLAEGDPEARDSRSLPMEDAEREFLLARYENNINKIAAECTARQVPICIIEPASSLTAPPLASGKLYDMRALNAWNAGTDLLKKDAAAAREQFELARDLDPAPVRMSRALRARLRAAGATPVLRVEGGEIENSYIDFVHPEPALAARFAERIAAGIINIKESGSLANCNFPALGKDWIHPFRAACAAILDSPEPKQVIREGGARGRLLAAHMYLQYGNRAASEAVIRAIPVAEREFGMFLLFDLALRFRGAADEAGSLLSQMQQMHPDWKPALDWWQASLAKYKL